MTPFEGLSHPPDKSVDLLVPDVVAEDQQGLLDAPGLAQRLDQLPAQGIMSTHVCYSTQGIVHRESCPHMSAIVHSQLETARRQLQNHQICQLHKQQVHLKGKSS